MEIGARIRKNRNEMGLSQEQLAQKVYVSRQTVSNWETGKNYPDLQSLLLLSAVFDVTLDRLVKGDIEKMKEEIRTEDIRKFEQMGLVFTVLLIVCVLAAIPLAQWLGWVGMAVWGLLYAITLAAAVRVEKFKKAHDLHTYREIVAFSEGRRLDEREALKESGKYPYQQVLLVIGSAAVTAVIMVIMTFLFR